MASCDVVLVYINNYSEDKQPFNQLLVPITAMILSVYETFDDGILILPFL